MKNLICTVFIFSLHFTFAKCGNYNYIEYYKYINEGEYYFFNNDYKIALEYYKKGISLVKIPFDRHTYYYAICLWNLNKKKKAIAILDTNRFTELGMSYHINYFKDITNQEKETILKNNKPFIKLKYQKFKTKNAKLLQLLDSLGNIDRDIRLMIDTADSITENQIYIQMQTITNTTFVLLDSIFKIHGYLGGIQLFSRIPLRTIMLHGNVEWFQKNKLFLITELKKGNIIPEDIATYFDRHLYLRNFNFCYYNRYCNCLSDDVTPDEYFIRANKIGLSPYFIYSDLLPKYGEKPRKTKFYNSFHEKKNSYNCVKSR